MIKNLQSGRQEKISFMTFLLHEEVFEGHQNNIKNQ